MFNNAFGPVYSIVIQTQPNIGAEAQAGKTFFDRVGQLFFMNFGIALNTVLS